LILVEPLEHGCLVIVWPLDQGAGAAIAHAWQARRRRLEMVQRLAHRAKTAARLWLLRWLIASKAVACWAVRGNPSRTKPFCASGAARRSSMSPMVTSSGTSLP